MQNLFNLIFIIFLLIFTGCSQNLTTAPILEGSVREGFVKIQDGQLYYQIVGKGDPIIVIHGGPGLDQRYLLPGMALLSKKHQVVFYDQAGCGRSTVSTIDEQHINIDRFVEDIETLRRSLGFQKVTLVGHSWGGMLAMYYALKYEKNVKKMVIMNSLPITTAGLHEVVDEIQRRIQPSSSEIEKIQESQEFLNNDPQAISQYYRLIFHYYFHNPADLEKLNTNIEPTGAATCIQSAKILENSLLTKFIDLTDSLKNLKIPTLITYGDSDVISGGAIKEIVKTIKNSRLVIQKQCGHFPYIEKPEEWLEVVEEFLATP